MSDTRDTTESALSAADHRTRCHNYNPDGVIAHLHGVNDRAEAEIERLRTALNGLLLSGLDHDDFVLVHRDDWSRARAALPLSAAEASDGTL